MKEHTTNYFNTFIKVSEDTKATQGIVPPVKGDRLTTANIQFEMISKHPYQHTSDDVLFQVFVEKNDISAGDIENARKLFFSKGQACMRTSPLTKSYGWGVHFDHEGKAAIYPVDSVKYHELANKPDLTILTAMRQKRK